MAMARVSRFRSVSAEIMREARDRASLKLVEAGAEVNLTDIKSSILGVLSVEFSKISAGNSAAAPLSDAQWDELKKRICQELNISRPESDWLEPSQIPDDYRAQAQFFYGTFSYKSFLAPGFFALRYLLDSFNPAGVSSGSEKIAYEKLFWNQLTGLIEQEPFTQDLRLGVKVQGSLSGRAIANSIYDIHQNRLAERHAREGWVHTAYKELDPALNAKMEEVTVELYQHLIHNLPGFADYLKLAEDYQKADLAVQEAVNVLQTIKSDLETKQRRFESLKDRDLAAVAEAEVRAQVNDSLDFGNGGSSGWGGGRKERERDRLIAEWGEERARLPGEIARLEAQLSATSQRLAPEIDRLREELRAAEAACKAQDPYIRRVCENGTMQAYWDLAEERLSPEDFNGWILRLREALVRTLNAHAVTAVASAPLVEDGAKKASSAGAGAAVAVAAMPLPATPSMPMPGVVYAQGGASSTSSQATDASPAVAAQPPAPAIVPVIEDTDPEPVAEEKDSRTVDAASGATGVYATARTTFNPSDLPVPPSGPVHVPVEQANSSAPPALAMAVRS